MLYDYVNCVYNVNISDSLWQVVKKIFWEKVVLLEQAWFPIHFFLEKRISQNFNDWMVAYYSSLQELMISQEFFPLFSQHRQNSANACCNKGSCTMQLAFLRQNRKKNRQNQKILSSSILGQRETLGEIRITSNSAKFGLF